MQGLQALCDGMSWKVPAEQGVGLAEPAAQADPGGQLSTGCTDPWGQ